MYIMFHFPGFIELGGASVFECLNEEFLVWRLGTKVSQKSPPKSPDLCDFDFLCGHFKSLVYVENTSDLYCLQRGLFEACMAVTTC